MSAPDPHASRHKPARYGLGAVLSAALFAAAPACAATSAPQAVRVTVELKAEAARCATTHTPQPGSPPSQVTVKCNAGQAQPRSPGYLLHVYRGYDWLGAVDSHMATGTVTSWRIVNIANRDYLEMMVGW